MKQNNEMEPRPVTKFTPVAESFAGESSGNPGWWAFKLKDSPDHLKYLLVNEACIRSLLHSWDRKSDINHHFSGGKNMLIPAEVLKQLVGWFTLTN